MISLIDLLLSKQQKKVYEDYIDRITLRLDGLNPLRSIKCFLRRTNNRYFALFIVVVINFIVCHLCGDYIRENYLLKILNHPNPIDISQGNKYLASTKTIYYILITPSVLLTLGIILTLLQEDTGLIKNTFYIILGSALVLEILFTFNGFSSETLRFVLDHGGFAGFDLNTFLGRFLTLSYSRSIMIAFGYMIALVLFLFAIIIYTIIYFAVKIITTTLWRITEYKDGYVKATILIFTVIINILLSSLIYIKGYF